MAAAPSLAAALQQALHSRRFTEAFVKGFGVIGSSEIGDKTFFIAAIMAMRHSRLTVFCGALGALAVMTALSAALGWAAPALIPKAATHYIATALFFFFGLKSLWGALAGGGGGESELAEVEAELADGRGSRDRLAGYRGGGKGAKGGKGGKGGAKGGRVAAALASLVSPIFLNAFTLTFLAEWGDRSQIATIGLAASHDAVGVTVGSILGHACCTLAAVLGGKHLASHIDERTVHIVGGLLFLAFGAHSLWEGPQQ